MKIGVYGYVTREASQEVGGKTTRQVGEGPTRAPMSARKSDVGSWHKTLCTARGRARTFAGTPSLTIVKLLLSVAAEKPLAIMLFDIKYALLYGAMRRNVYAELLRQDPEVADGKFGQVEEGHAWEQGRPSPPRASKASRGVATVNYVAQYRPGLAATAGVLPKRMGAPTGVEIFLERATRCMASNPREVLLLPCGHVEAPLRL